jgi:colicin import membrane protein
MTVADSLRRVKGLAKRAIVLVLCTAWLSTACAEADALPATAVAGLAGFTEPAKDNSASSSDSELRVAYIQAVQRAVITHWLRPESAQRGLRCTVEIRQDSVGSVTELEIVEPCNADAATRESIAAAVRRAEPLPHEGFESVQAASVRFVFRYE